MSERPALPAKKSILVVDDEPNILSMIAAALTSFGYEVKCARDAFDAMRLFRQRSWDAVITDRMMPGLNGEDLAAQIRAHRPELPILMLTGTGSPQRPDLFCTVLQKPILILELREGVRRALEGAAARQPAAA